MGNQLFDQYSLLHFSTGIIAYFWGVPAVNFFLAHATFEVLENTEPGMKFINTFRWWPGGKPHADSLTNIVGDNIAAMAGFWSAYKLDEIGKTRNWYKNV